MTRKAAFALALLGPALTACNDEAGPGGPPAAPRTPESASAAAAGTSSAGRDGVEHRLVDGVACFDEEAAELRVTLASFPLSERHLGIMTDFSDIREIPSDQPYLEITFGIEDPSRPLSPGNVSDWRLVFWNFGGGPMTLGRWGDDESLAELSGRLTPDGTVELRTAAEEDWRLGDDERTYRWSIDHRVPVHGASPAAPR